MTSITSVELNYLVFRYLQESGFTHSAFALGYEAGINRCPIDGSLVPPGALVTFVQKGLQYLEMEANSTCQSDTDVDEDFSILQPLDLITKNVYELRRMIKEKKKNLQKSGHKEFEKEHDGEFSNIREKEKKDREKECEKDKERVEKSKQREKLQEHHNDRDMAMDVENKADPR